MFNTVEELLNHKGRDVATIVPSATALQAARLMNDQRIGSLVVTDGHDVIGILSERDLLTRVIARELAPSHTPVAEVMTTPVLTCTPETALSELRWLMREKRIRHVPVVHDGALVGIVSIGDLNVAEAETLSETIKYLEAYICS